MSDRDDGGPAFPRSTGNVQGREGYFADPGEIGMTLRDYFAGEALKGIAISDPTAVTGHSSRTSDDDSLERANVAWSCYAMADAMLKARKE